MTPVDSPTSASPLFTSSIVSPDHLTADGMMIYLQSRLGGLDEQIGAIMDKQKASETARKALQHVQNELAKVGEEGGDVNLATFANGLNEIAACMGPEAAAEVLKNCPEAVSGKLDLDTTTGLYAPAKDATTAPLSKEDLTNMKSYIDNAIKDVESGAELEMIKLQSLMSARNTAISLATNMMSAIGKGQEAIVGNIGR